MTGVGVDGAQRASPTGRATRGMYVRVSMFNLRGNTYALRPSMYNLGWDARVKEMARSGLRNGIAGHCALLTM